jgi:hypothetical protein
MNISEINDIAGRFDISDSEAKRIAANANNEAEFIKIWENDDWWTDSNTAKRFKAAGDALNAGIEADHGNTFIPVCLSDEGQAHVADELKRHGIDWDVSAVCSEIEDGLLGGLTEMRVGSDDTYDYEITNNAASRAGVCQAGYGVFAYIEITAAMVQFEAAQ